MLETGSRCCASHPEHSKTLGHRKGGSPKPDLVREGRPLPAPHFLVLCRLHVNRFCLASDASPRKWRHGAGRPPCVTNVLIPGYCCACDLFPTTLAPTAARYSGFRPCRPCAICACRTNATGCGFLIAVSVSRARGIGFALLDPIEDRSLPGSDTLKNSLSA